MKVLLFDNPDEFLKVMDELQQEYNKKYGEENGGLKPDTKE